MNYTNPNPPPHHVAENSLKALAQCYRSSGDYRSCFLQDDPTANLCMLSLNGMKPDWSNEVYQHNFRVPQSMERSPYLKQTILPIEGKQNYLKQNTQI